MFYFATGLHPLWWLLWIAPVPVLVVAPIVSRRLAFFTAFGAYALGGLNLWAYFHNLLSTPIPLLVLFITLPAAAFAAAVLLFRWLLTKSIWKAAFVFPSFWVACEFLTAINSPHSTAGNLGYTQMDFLPILQIASVTGIWAISFCVLSFASTVAILLARFGDPISRRNLAIVVASLLIAVVGLGFWRLHSGAAFESLVKVGLIASDLRQNLLTETRGDTLRQVHDYSTQVEALAAQGAKAVVIPEKIAVVTDESLPEFDTRLRSTASQTNTLIVVGIIHSTTGAKWNEARVYFPDGSIRTYEKHHMLPVYEGNLTVGTERAIWQEPSGRWGVAICKDMDFPQLSRQYGNDGVALMLVPAWDFVADGWWHGRMAILRGIESGFSIARAPKEGLLTVSDSRGRVLVQSSSSSSSFTTVLAELPVHREFTLYQRFGDWFGWLNLGLLAILVFTGKRFPGSAPIFT
jgi:apolipoprotein N-acyltransferase